MSRSFNIEIRAWDTDNKPEDVITHVTAQIEKGFTSGHDMGLYWAITEPDKAKAKIKDAAPDLLLALEASERALTACAAWLQERGKHRADSANHWAAEARTAIDKARGGM